MGPSAEYKFLRTKDGLTSFAKVVLRLRESTGISMAAVEAETDCLADRSEKPRDQWLQAAVAGCHDAIADAKSDAGPRILIKSIEGTVIDTTPDAIHCAAYIAAMQLLMTDAPAPRISNDRPWQIVR